MLQVIQVQEQPEPDGPVHLHVGFEGNGHAAVFAEFAMDHALEGFRETASLVSALSMHAPSGGEFLEAFLAEEPTGKKTTRTWSLAHVQVTP